MDYGLQKTLLRVLCLSHFRFCSNINSACTTFFDFGWSLLLIIFAFDFRFESSNCYIELLFIAALDVFLCSLQHQIWFHYKTNHKTNFYLVSFSKNIIHQQWTAKNFDLDCKKFTIMKVERPNSYCTGCKWLLSVWRINYLVKLYMAYSNFDVLSVNEQGDEDR